MEKAERILFIFRFSFNIQKRDPVCKISRKFNVRNEHGSVIFVNLSENRMFATKGKVQKKRYVYPVRCIPFFVLWCTSVAQLYAPQRMGPDIGRPDRQSIFLMEFPELAVPCSFRGCYQKNDFLPFTCPGCSQKFCLDHHRHEKVLPGPASRRPRPEL